MSVKYLAFTASIYVIMAKYVGQINAISAREAGRTLSVSGFPPRYQLMTSWHPYEKQPIKFHNQGHVNTIQSPVYSMREILLGLFPHMTTVYTLEGRSENYNLSLKPLYFNVFSCDYNPMCSKLLMYPTLLIQGILVKHNLGIILETLMARTAYLSLFGL